MLWLHRCNDGIMECIACDILLHSPKQRPCKTPPCQEWLLPFSSPPPPSPASPPPPPPPLLTLLSPAFPTWTSQGGWRSQGWSLQESDWGRWRPRKWTMLELTDKCTRKHTWIKVGRSSWEENSVLTKLRLRCPPAFPFVKSSQSVAFIQSSLTLFSFSSGHKK